jgi:hypothetical protein
MSEHTEEENDLLAVLNIYGRAGRVPVGCDGCGVLSYMNRGGYSPTAAQLQVVINSSKDALPRGK